MTGIKNRLMAIINKLFPISRQKGPAYAWIGAFLLCLLVVLLNINSNPNVKISDNFEVGKVADQDVIAEKTITYIDENATRLKMEAQERLVPAVFWYSKEVSEELESRWSDFLVLAETHSPESSSGAAFRQDIHSKFPDLFDLANDDALDLLYNSEEKELILSSCTLMLKAILGSGIYLVPDTGLENLNQEMLELIRKSDTRFEQERVTFWNIVTPESIPRAIQASIVARSFPQRLSAIAIGIMSPFLRENVFYSPEDTERRISEARARTEPVTHTIERGKRIIRQGFVVTEGEMTELRALKLTAQVNELSMSFACLLFLIMLFCLLSFFSGKRTFGRDLTDRETYLVCALSALYIAGSVLCRNMPHGSMPASVVIPTALVIILPSILIHPRLAFMLAMALPLGAFFTGSFDTPSYIFALVSGIVAAYSLQGAEKRMDLVKAGFVIAAANIAAMTAVLLWQRSPAVVFPTSLFWAAFNGVASGMLVLGLLPLLENALNAATSFRLIELSDLNAPILRRLFTVAPGTYSHSIMVASLAEAACQEIGANYLLARVGAYYHDLGKMENPEYFVENQTGGNPHDDMSPRLSATVIRSHVKLGVEKARQLRLPKEVIDIISEHHGNSVITWFYSKALQQEDQKKAAITEEDFRYPGVPPCSRESAVVMLADMAEAAVRTLDKPTAPKIEKYIQELIEKKVEHGQLNQTELTFRNIETIKNAFVLVLAGYYHTRIEYPKITLPSDVKEVSEA